MASIRTDLMLRRLNEVDTSICLLLNRTCRYKSIVRFFSIISKIGDGAFQYSLIVLLPVIYGLDALGPSLHLFFTGLAGLVVYKLIKHSTGRSRPCNAHKDIFLAADPLDLYSFPSGHTLHAMSFTVVVSHYYPELAVVCVPFLLSIALSRIILGLHYPTDVIAGAIIGLLIALAGIQFV